MSRPLSPPLSTIQTALLVLSGSILTPAYITSAQAYTRSTTEAGDEAHWFTRCVPIWLSDSGSGRIPIADVERDLFDSLNAWDQVSCAQLALSYQGLTSLSSIGFDPTPNAENQNTVIFQSQAGSWIHDPRAVGLTTVTMCQNETPQCSIGTIIDADIELNEVDFQLTSSSERTRMDLANTLTHEVGHLLGLDHTPLSNATMYAEAPEGETKKRSLSADDEAGICEIFPSDSGLYCVLTSYDLVSGPPQGSTEGSEDNMNRGGGTEDGCSAFTRSTDSAHPLPLYGALLLSILWYERRRLRRS